MDDETEIKLKEYRKQYYQKTKEKLNKEREFIDNITKEYKNYTNK